MPELPLVEKSRKEAVRRLKGRRIVAVRAVRDPIMMPGLSPAQFVNALRGARITGAGRRGKYLWLESDHRPWLVMHFGMTGELQYRKTGQPAPKHWRVDLDMDNGTSVALADPRRFGRALLVGDPLREPPVSELGVDPYLDPMPASDFVHALRMRRAPVKAVLLDQSFVAGVGNWIADEIFYQAAIAPHRRAHTLTEIEGRCIHAALLEVVRVAVKANNDERRFPATWLFHHRWGKVKGARTARGEPIRFSVVGGRTTAWVERVTRTPLRRSDASAGTRPPRRPG
jgi:formamidopyrimidine-DNA glycosylase